MPPPLLNVAPPLFARQPDSTFKKKYPHKFIINYSFGWLILSVDPSKQVPFGQTIGWELICSRGVYPKINKFKV